jgi:pumilio RNA-binding family
VVQKVIECIPPEDLDFVVHLKGHVKDIACHAYGCRVLQRIVENSPRKKIRPLLDELRNDILELMQDQFGVRASRSRITLELTGPSRITSFNI